MIQETAFLSFILFGFIENFIKPIFNDKKDENGNPIPNGKPEYDKWKWTIPYISLLISIPICVYFGLDNVSPNFHTDTNVFGSVITGMVITMGGAAFHGGNKLVVEKVKELKANNEE